MQLRPFYFDIQINVSPWFAAQKTFASRVASFPHICTSADYFSEPFYTISLQFCKAERLAFRLYDALKIRSTSSFSFLTILQYSKTADFRLYTKYELQSIESFYYTNFIEYGIKSFGYIFDMW